MRREACKFLSGSFAALAYAHAAYAIAVSSGVMSEPVFLGRRWSSRYAWIEAAVYSAASLVLGYAGWVAESEDPQCPSAPAGNGQTGPAAGSVPPVQSVAL